MSLPTPRTLDDLHVRLPARYGDKGPEGWYPEHQPLRTRLVVEHKHGEPIWVDPRSMSMYPLDIPVDVPSLRSNLNMLGRIVSTTFD
jgi:hypothetical protein